MFSTKQDALNWINCFGKGLSLTTQKNGKYWRIYDKDGGMLSESNVCSIEDGI